MIRRSLAWMVIVAVLVGLATPVLAQTGTQPAAPKPPAKPAAAKDKSASGTVKSATATSLVLVGKDKKEWTFGVTKDTKITRGDKAVDIKDIRANETATVTYAEANGKMTAKTVKLRAATAAAKPKP